MSPETLWNRYAAIWSQGNGDRIRELAVCLSDDVTYCDPNSSVIGHAALSSYMEVFQQNVPGGKFRINTVSHHHDRTLAQWTLLGADDNVMGAGVSFGVLARDGKLSSITGFFVQIEPPQSP